MRSVHFLCNLRPALMGLLLAMVVCLWFSAWQSACASEGPDPYRSWQQGRPAESLPLLWQQAEATQHWAAWYDAGVCAVMIEDRVSAARALLAAHRAAPWRGEARELLARYDLPAPPAMYQDRLGPWPALLAHWWGFLLIVLLALALAFLLASPWRRPAAVMALILALLLLPPLFLRSLDQGQMWWVLSEDSVLIDAGGEPIVSLPAGTLLLPGSIDPTHGRIQVRDPDQRQGFVAQAQLLPVP